jgi:uncharacterized RDD family membrane protein YckC
MPPPNDDPGHRRDVLAPPPDAAPKPPQAQVQPAPPPEIQPEAPAPPPGTVLVNGRVYAPAGFWPRAAAFAIDFVILSLLSSILVWIAGVPEPDVDEVMRVISQVFGKLMTGAMPSEATIAQLQELQRPARFAGWLNVAMCGAYFTLMHGLAATTLGKLCLGLTILRRDGSAVGPWLALGRYLLYFVCAKLIYTAWLIPFNSERRTLYDMLTATNVFRAVKK